MTTEERVTALEQRANRYRNAFVVLVVVLCGVAVIGATRGANYFLGKGVTLSNESGEVVVRLGVAASEGGFLQLYSKNGGIAFNAAVSESGVGYLQIGSARGRNMIEAASDDDGFYIHGYNKTGQAVVSLITDEYGNGVVGAYNRKGKGRTLKPGP